MSSILIPKGDPRWPKHLTCYYWANGSCRFTAETCKYAHAQTGKVAGAPMQVYSGHGPAVAGKNAEEYRQQFAAAAVIPRTTIPAYALSFSEPHTPSRTFLPVSAVPGSNQQYFDHRDSDLPSVLLRRLAAIDNVFKQSIQDTAHIRMASDNILAVVRMWPRQSPIAPEAARLIHIAEDLMKIAERQKGVQANLACLSHITIEEADDTHLSTGMRNN